MPKGVSQRDEDAKALAEAYQVAEEKGKAFVKAMEAAFPVYIAMQEARKQRDEMRTTYRAKYLGPKPETTKEP
jgi:hypothetical protein